MESAVIHITSEDKEALLMAISKAEETLEKFEDEDVAFITYQPWQH